MPRPRGPLGGGLMRAAMRQSRYQRYYDRGSQANWEAIKREDAAEARAICMCLSYAAIGLTAFFMCLAPTAPVMLILAAPFWIPAVVYLWLN